MQKYLIYQDDIDENPYNDIEVCIAMALLIGIIQFSIIFCIISAISAKRKKHKYNKKVKHEVHIPDSLIKGSLFIIFEKSEIYEQSSFVFLINEDKET